MTKRPDRALTVVLALSLVALLPLRAEEDSPGQESAGGIVVGPQWYVDEETRGSAKFEEFRDVPSGFVAERLFYFGQSKQRYFLDFNARDITQKDQQIVLRYGKRDLWTGYVTWMENPRRWTDQAHQLYTSQGGGIFTLNDTLQSAIQAAPASVDVAPADGEWDSGTKGALVKSALATSAPSVFVGFQRRTGSVGFDYTPTRSWTFGLRGERERRGGTTPQSLGMYFQLSPSEVAAPVDFQTDTLALNGEYARKNWLVGAQVSTSKFQTGYDTLTWDDQLFLNDTAVNANTANPGRGRLTLGVDNDSRSATVYGGANLPGHTRLDATAALTETKQDDPFLPMTINSLLVAAPLPATSLDGKYRNTLEQLRLSGRPLRWLRWGAWARRYEQKNETPSLRFTDYVMTDFQFPTCSNGNECGAVGARLQRRNLPYGYAKTNAGLSVGFKPGRWVDLGASVEREGIDREFSAVESSKEWIYKVSADFDVASWLTVKTTVRRQERRADGYDAEYNLASFPIGEAFVAAANEGERKFPWTDRDRDSAALLADVTLTDKVSIYAEATFAKDTYLDPETGRKVGSTVTILEDRDFDTVPESHPILLAGRTFDRNRTYTLGVSFAPVRRFNAYADYTWEKFQYRMVSRFRTPPGGTGPTVIGSDASNDDWGSDIDDRYRTASLGFDLSLAKADGWKILGDVSRSTGTGDISTDFAPGGNPSGNTTLTEFPQLKTTLTIATLGLNHAVNRRLDYTLRYWYERWHEFNWASDQSQPYMGDPTNDPGSVTSIYLGLDYLNYTNQIATFMVRYRFN